MFETILHTTRDASIILLAIVGMALSAVTLILLWKLVAVIRRYKPRVKGGIRQGAAFALKASAAVEKGADAVARPAATVQSAPTAMRAGLRALLRRRPKEAAHV